MADLEQLHRTCPKEERFHTPRVCNWSSSNWSTHIVHQCRLHIERVDQAAECVSQSEPHTGASNAKKRHSLHCKRKEFTMRESVWHGPHLWLSFLRAEFARQAR